MRLKLTVDNLSNEMATLLTDSGDKILWPVPLLPKETKAGETIFIEVSSANQAEKQNQISAKDILNEILDIDK